MKKTGLTKDVNSSLFYAYNKFDKERFVQFICKRCRSLGIINSLPTADESLSLIDFQAEWHAPIRPETELLISVFLEKSEEENTFIFSALVEAGNIKVYSAKNITLKIGGSLMLERVHALIERATSSKAQGGVYEFA